MLSPYLLVDISETIKGFYQIFELLKELLASWLSLSYDYGRNSLYGIV